MRTYNIRKLSFPLIEMAIIAEVDASRETTVVVVSASITTS